MPSHPSIIVVRVVAAAFVVTAIFHPTLLPSFANIAAAESLPIPLPITMTSKSVGTFFIENPCLVGSWDGSSFGHAALRIHDLHDR
jgi:hypothetical protein